MESQDSYLIANIFLYVRFIFSDLLSFIANGQNLQSNHKTLAFYKYNKQKTQQLIYQYIHRSINITASVSQINPTCLLYNLVNLLSNNFGAIDRIMDAKTNPFLKVLAPFAIGGFSGAVATSVIQPLDTLKVQVQIISQQLGRGNQSNLSLSTIIRKIKNDQGLQVLYRGLDSAIFRQLFYASARLGAYQVLVKKWSQYKQQRAGKLDRAFISFISGAIGALVGNPFDVALIRRQASIANGKNAYKNTYQAFSKMIKTEGILSLWSGINITILRVGLINLGQLAGRDIISQMLQPFEIKHHNTVVALLASFLTSIISLPSDNIKVKLQKQEMGQKTYKGIWDCLKISIAREGILRLWVGFPIYFIRGAPHSFILIRTQMFLTQKWRDLTAEK